MERTLLRLGSALVDLERGSVLRDGVTTDLTDKEVALLRYLASQDAPASQEQLLEEVWNYSRAVVSRTVRVTVARLRKKLERDPAAPEHLINVYSEGYLLVQTPALPVVPRGVPAEVDRFVGREALLDDLERELATGRRLVTLVGPPGIGKTRLAHRLAATRAGERAAWLCELAAAHTSDDVTATVARALGVQLTADDPVAQVGRALRGRGPVLLVLDNVEQVADHAPDTVSRWLRLAGSTQVVATSRRPLRLRGERLVEVPPLDASEAVELLVERAGSLGVTVDVDQAQVLSEAVQGVPLAVELVASQLLDATVDEVHAAIVARMTELRTHLRDAHERHTSLRAALDTSWARTTEAERAALRACAVFRGGFDREAAAAVVGDLDLVERLRERSLLRRVDDRRTDMFEAVRQYVGRPTDEVLDRHARHFATWGERLDAAIVDTSVRQALRREVPNLEAAIAHAASEPLVLALAAAHEGQVPARRILAHTAPLADRPRVGIAHGNALRLAGDLEAADAALAAVIASSDAPGIVGHARLEQGLLHAERALPDAVDLLTTAVEELTRAGDQARVGRALGPLGVAHLRRRDLPAARAALERGLEVTRQTGDRAGECSTLANLCTVLREEGRLDRAVAVGEQAVALLEDLDSRRKEGLILVAVAMALDAIGQRARARELTERGVEVFRALGSAQYEGVALAHLGNIVVRQGDQEGARRLFQRALALSREVGDRNQEAVTLGNLGHCNLDLGRLDEAADALSAAIAMHAERGNVRAEGHFLCVLAEVESQRGQGAALTATLDRAEALLREAGDAMQLANLLLTRVRLEGRRDLLPEATELVDRTGAGPESSLRRALREL